MAAVGAQSRNNKPKGNVVATYDYTDADGKLLYQVLRYEPKDFRQRRPDGNGGWIWKLEERRVLYRWPELLKFPDATVFVMRRRKGCRPRCRAWTLRHDCCCRQVDRRMRQGARRPRCRHLEDNDDAGRAKALAAAQALHGTAKTIRIVSLPDLPDKGDVSDWLDADPRRAEKLERVCYDVPVWMPGTG